MPATSWPLYSDSYLRYEMAEALNMSRKAVISAQNRIAEFQQQALPVSFIHGELAEAVEAFRRVNCGGTPIPHHEVERLIGLSKGDAG